MRYEQISLRSLGRPIGEGKQSFLRIKRASVHSNYPISLTRHVTNTLPHTPEIFLPQRDFPVATAHSEYISSETP
jgi:hypothetical protein